MKFIFPILIISILLLASCIRQEPHPVPAPLPKPKYIGTYIGQDSIQTIDNGIVVATNVYNKAFEVVENSTINKNVMLQSFQGFDTTAANFTNGNISIFHAQAPSIFNFVGTYKILYSSITYQLEYVNVVTMRVFGSYNLM
jgi:hypothetical protein